MLKHIKNKILSKLFPNRFWLLKDLYPQYSIGVGSYGKPQILDWGEGSTFKMGNYCSVALDVQILLGGEHEITRPTTYPFDTLEQYSDYVENVNIPQQTKGDVVVGNDVWICRGAMILSGVTIGDGAVIAARSIVTHDVPAYAVVAGNPAKIIKYRFDDDIKARLLDIQWWNWGNDRLQKAIPYLVDNQIESFLDGVDSGEI